MSRSEVQLYITGLVRKGYTKVALEKSKSYIKQTLTKGDATIVVSYSRNGWISIS